MSFRAVLWALKQRTESASAKLVLIKLADNANDDGRCFPSMAYIAEHCEMSVRTVRDQIRRLEEKGLLITERRQQEGVWLPNAYRLKLEVNNAETEGENGTANSAVLRQPSPEGTADSAGGVRQILPPNQSVEPVNKPKDPPTPQEGGVTDLSDADRMVEVWNEVAAANGLPTCRHLTPDRRRKLLARLRELSGFPDWQEACARVAQSDFLLGKGPRGWRASLDFMARPGAAMKVLEGAYDGKGGNVDDAVERAMNAKVPW